MSGYYYYSRTLRRSSLRTNCNLNLVVHYAAAGRTTGITDQARTILVPNTDVAFYKTNTVTASALYSVWGTLPACLFWSTVGPAYALSPPDALLSTRSALSARVSYCQLFALVFHGRRRSPFLRLYYFCFTSFFTLL